MAAFTIIHDIKRGDLIEFSDEWHRDWPPADESKQRFGVALGPMNDRGWVRVMLADRSEFDAYWVHSYGWLGWMPEALEPVFAEIRGYIDEGEEL